MSIMPPYQTLGGIALTRHCSSLALCGGGQPASEPNSRRVIWLLLFSRLIPPLTAAEGEVSNPPDRMAADFSIVSSLIVDDDLQQ